MNTDRTKQSVSLRMAKLRKDKLRRLEIYKWQRAELLAAGWSEGAIEREMLALERRYEQ